MPSTNSSSVAIVLLSSTVMTPSLPTFSTASASRLPMAASLLALMVPTWAISFLLSTGWLFAFSSSTTAATASWMPRLSAMGFMPAATALRPSR